MVFAQLHAVPDIAAAFDTDSAVLVRAAGGDRRAFEQIYRRHSGWVFGLCLRLAGQRELAEDCTQETFVAAWRGLSGFERRSKFSTWLHRIAVNSVLARRRRPGDIEPPEGEASAAEALNVTGAM